MQIHARYSITLAEMGSNRDEIHELAVRRAAEVRRRLGAMTSTAAAVEDSQVDFVKAATEPPSDTPPDAYSPADAETIAEVSNPDTAAEHDHGSLFSARA